MKKLLAILLAAMMLLSMVACNMGDNPDNPNKDNPGTSQSDNQGGTENQGGEEKDADGWPIADYIGDYMKWNGAGEIVYVENDTIQDDWTGKRYPCVNIYIDVADLDEVNTYINTLKNAGFSYIPARAEAEPAVEIPPSGWFGWVGSIPGECYVALTYSEDVRQDVMTEGDATCDISYKLVIGITSRTIESGRQNIGGY